MIGARKRMANWFGGMLAAALCSTTLLVSACTQSPGAVADDPHAANIAKIEASLAPRLVIEGEAALPIRLVDRMAFYKVPGVSLAFFDDEHVLWTRQYGVASVAANRPVTRETIFQASSISKVATALATLRLVRDGVLDLDEDVNAKLKSWKIPESQFMATQKVTVRRLLSHSAGVTVSGFSGYEPGAPLPTTLQILHGAAPANSPAIVVDATPGAAFRYSGGGYVVLQQLIEDVSGQPFATVLDRLVLQPASMTHSSFSQPLAADLRPNAASAHASDSAPIVGGGMVFPEMAPAGLWSTPSDLANLAIELARELDGRSDRILDQSLSNEMMKRTSGSWGLGVNVGAGPEPVFSHVGNNTGFQSFLIFSPQRKQGLVVMTNGNSQSGFYYEIVMAVAKEYGWPGFTQIVRKTVPVPGDVLAQYAGNWLADDAQTFDVKVESGKLYVQGGPFGPLPVELHAQSPTAFFILSTGFTFDFSAAAENKAVLGGAIKAVRTGRS